MKFGHIDNLVLFGGSRLTAELLPIIKKRYKVVLFTSQRQLNDVIYSDGRTLQDVLKENKITFFASEDINTDQTLKKYASKTSLGLALGAAWIFKKPVLDLFENRMLDFMGIRLPKFRGGAHYTWQILMGDKLGSCNLQLINDVPDSGTVIMSREYKFPTTAKIPVDYFITAVKEELNFLLEFLDELSKNKNFIEKKIDENQSMYLPFLNTKIQGFVNWNWNSEEILKFICAFDEPYAGASTFLEDTRVFLKTCEMIKDSEVIFHPFQSGLIYRKNKEGIYVAASPNSILIKKMVDENGKDIMNLASVGKRLYTPNSILDEIMKFRAIYTPKGLKKS